MDNKVAEIRKAKGISQEKLAKEVNISRSYLSEIETGKAKNIIDNYKFLQEIER